MEDYNQFKKELDEIRDEANLMVTSSTQEGVREALKRLKEMKEEKVRACLHATACLPGVAHMCTHPPPPPACYCPPPSLTACLLDWLCVWPGHQAQPPVFLILATACYHCHSYCLLLPATTHSYCLLLPVTTVTATAVTAVSAALPHPPSYSLLPQWPDHVLLPATATQDTGAALRALVAAYPGGLAALQVTRRAGGCRCKVWAVAGCYV